LKSINDRSGHAVGNAVLQLSAKVARETLRGSDIVGRLGGEEFVALLSATLAEAGIAAEGVRATTTGLRRRSALGSPAARAVGCGGFSH
jgi:diguanylate cyclase (GGDEF)-like protein